MTQAHSQLKLSIVTATFNRDSYLPKCIESVVRQSYPYKEHIIVDGGSTDATVSILKEYAAKYPHIRWISEPDNGISDALNKGLAMATGDAVCVIGDDDSYVPEIFGIVASELERDENAAVVAGNCEMVDENGHVLTILRASFTSHPELIQCWRYWGRGITIATPSTFIRKSVIDEVGGFEVADRYAMDYRLWIKITEEFSSLRTVDIVFSRFRFDRGTVSFSSSSNQWQEVLKISREYWGSVTSLGYYKNLFSYLRYYRLPKLRDRIIARGSLLKRRLLGRARTA